MSRFNSPYNKEMNDKIGDLSNSVETALNKIETTKKPISYSRLPFFAHGEYLFNGVSFIQDNLTVFNGYQYAVWINYQRYPMIAKRKLPLGEWTSFDLGPFLTRTNIDGHNIYSLAVDEQGYIHVSGNMHNVPLLYARSKNPEDITQWETPGMTGVREDYVTYPAFVKKKDGSLLFIYRRGVSGESLTCINSYNAQTKTWTKLQDVFIDGLSSQESAYLNHIAVGKDGSIQIMWCWRGTGNANSNNDICYAKSLDGGVTWKKSDGTAYTLPITHATAEVVIDTADIGSGLLNQNGFEIDNNGHPHGTYMKYDANGYTQLYHLWHDGSVWHEDKVTNFSRVQNTNTNIWPSEIARPSILVTKSNRVFIIFRVNYAGKNGTVRMIEVTRGIDQFIDFEICKFDLYGWEPTFDTQALYQRNELHMMIVPSTPGVDGTGTLISNTWNYQMIGVLSIDLDQIDKFLRKEVPLPEIKTNRTLLGTAKQTVTNTTITDLPIGVIPLAEKSDAPLFARLVFSGKVTTANTTLDVQIKNFNTTTSVVNYIGKNLITESTDTAKMTPWCFLRSNNGPAYLAISALLTLANGATSGSAEISGVSLEVGELINV